MSFIPFILLDGKWTDKKKSFSFVLVSTNLYLVITTTTTYMQIYFNWTNFVKYNEIRLSSFNRYSLMNIFGFQISKPNNDVFVNQFNWLFIKTTTWRQNEYICHFFAFFFCLYWLVIKNQYSLLSVNLQKLSRTFANILIFRFLY